MSGLTHRVAFNTQNFMCLNRRTFLAMMIAAIAGCLLSACGSAVDYDGVPQGRGVYYWRTSLSLDSAELAFLRDNNVSRMYVRFFDVVSDDDSGRPRPNATLSFPSGNVIPEGIEYVPVVFVTPGCFAGGKSDGLARLILNRVKDIAEAHDFSAPRELQIDCDWTPLTREAFMAFMREMHGYTRDCGMKLSSTIRLHQLFQTPPAADYGVLMVYNTGDLRQPQKGNPVLSPEAVGPYLHYLGDYELPLITALPNFRWPVLYRQGDGNKEEFAGILYGCHPEEQPSVFRKAGPDTWIAVSSELYSTALGNTENIVRVVPGMKLRVVSPPPVTQLLEIKSQLRRRQPHILQSVVLYDLNPDNLTIYRGDYEKVFAD